MEQAMLWVTIFGIIVLPLIGWLVNTLITKKIDDANLEISSLKKTVYSRLDEIQAEATHTFVRQDIYQQSKDYQEKDIDSKFKSMMATMTTQFTNVEDKIDDLKNTFKEKFNGKSI